MINFRGPKQGCQSIKPPRSYSCLWLNQSKFRHVHTSSHSKNSTDVHPRTKMANIFQTGLTDQQPVFKPACATDLQLVCNCVEHSVIALRSERAKGAETAAQTVIQTVFLESSFLSSAPLKFPFKRPPLNGFTVPLAHRHTVGGSHGRVSSTYSCALPSFK